MNTVVRVASDDGLVSVVEGALDSAFTGERLEHVAAVLNSRTGPVVVFAQPYGGVAALEAPYRTDRIARLMLYEPPLQELVDNNLAVPARGEEMVRKENWNRRSSRFRRRTLGGSPRRGSN
jgi:hypothetical protein